MRQVGKKGGVPAFGGLLEGGATSINVTTQGAFNAGFAPRFHAALIALGPGTLARTEDVTDSASAIVNNETIAALDKHLLRP